MLFYESINALCQSIFLSKPLLSRHISLRFRITSINREPRTENRESATRNRKKEWVKCTRQNLQIPSVPHLQPWMLPLPPCLRPACVSKFSTRWPWLILPVWSCHGAAPSFCQQMPDARPFPPRKRSPSPSWNWAKDWCCLPTSITIRVVVRLWVDQCGGIGDRRRLASCAFEEEKANRTAR